MNKTALWGFWFIMIKFAYIEAFPRTRVYLNRLEVPSGPAQRLYYVFNAKFRTSRNLSSRT